MDRGARGRTERRLIARLDAGDPGARDALAERFLPLARSLARRYEHSGEPIDDLVQVASLALVNAIDRFDSAKGCAFQTFAVPTIVGELSRHLRDRAWIVRPPRALQAGAGRTAISLQTPAGGEDSQSVLQDTLGSPDAGFACAESRIVLSGLKRGLSSRSREVLHLRYEHDMTQRQIGERLGVSTVQVHRLIDRALTRMRHAATFRDARPRVAAPV